MGQDTHSFHLSFCLPTSRCHPLAAGCPCPLAGWSATSCCVVGWPLMLLASGGPSGVQCHQLGCLASQPHMWFGTTPGCMWQHTNHTPATKGGGGDEANPAPSTSGATCHAKGTTLARSNTVPPPPGHPQPPGHPPVGGSNAMAPGVWAHGKPTTRPGAHTACLVGLATWCSHKPCLHNMVANLVGQTNTTSTGAPEPGHPG